MIQKVVLARGFSLKKAGDLIKYGGYIENSFPGGNPNRWFPGISFGLPNVEGGLGVFEDYAVSSALRKNEHPFVLEIMLSEKVFDLYKHQIYVIGLDPTSNRDQGRIPNVLEDIFTGVTINLPKEMLTIENLVAMESRIGTRSNKRRFSYLQIEEFLEDHEGKPRRLV